MSLFHQLQSEHMIALLSSIFLFCITIFLAVKRWVGFSVTFLLLLFSLLVGVVIDHKQISQQYFPSSKSEVDSKSFFSNENENDAFHKQLLQAVEDLKTEVSTEKENLRRVMNQMQEVFDSVDAQKQKLQNFIEETRERFKTEYPPTPPSSSSLKTQSDITNLEEESKSN